MEIKTDRLEILPLTHDALGQPLEPEERPASRILGTEIQTTLGGENNPTGRSVSAEIVLEDTAGQFATGFRKQCVLCKFFKPEAAEAILAKWERGNHQERHWLNQVRGMLATVRDEEVQASMQNPITRDQDIDLGLKEMGICEILTEIRKDITFVHMVGGCPPDHPDLFVQKDIDHEKWGSDKFDEIMRKAQGKS